MNYISIIFVAIKRFFPILIDLRIKFRVNSASVLSLVNYPRKKETRTCFIRPVVNLKLKQFAVSDRK